MKICYNNENDGNLIKSYVSYNTLANIIFIYKNKKRKKQNKTKICNLIKKIVVRRHQTIKI